MFFEYEKQSRQGREILLVTDKQNIPDHMCSQKIQKLYCSCRERFPPYLFFLLSISAKVNSHRSRSLMDRMLASEAGDAGSIPAESTIRKNVRQGVFSYERSIILVTTLDSPVRRGRGHLGPPGTGSRSAQHFCCHRNMLPLHIKYEKSPAVGIFHLTVLF
jgi:hypothetical protein